MFRFKTPPVPPLTEMFRFKTPPLPPLTEMFHFKTLPLPPSPAAKEGGEIDCKNYLVGACMAPTF